MEILFVPQGRALYLMPQSLEKGGQRIEDERWRMNGGGWRMEVGGWWLEDGGWKDEERMEEGPGKSGKLEYGSFFSSHGSLA